MYELLIKRYPPNEYALLQEVSDAPGHSRSRSADWVAVNLWPSRGHSVHCIEQKVSRYDWLKELKNPKKQENHIRYCDFMWLLSGDDQLARIDEIPPNWGWMAVRGKKLVVIKQAPILNPEPMTKSFFCALLKRAADKSGYVHRDSIKEEINKASEAAKEAAEKFNKYTEEKYYDLKKLVDEFCSKSGVNIERSWEVGNIAEAVKFVKNGGVNSIKQQLEQLKEKALQISLDIERTLKADGIKISNDE